MTPLLALVVNLPLGLAVIYVLAAVLWYELVRSAIQSRIARRSSKRAPFPDVQGWEEAERTEMESEAAEQEAAEAAEPDVARRLYYLARKSAKAERDLAIQTANEAAEGAVERIQARYREIAAELDADEAERLNDL